MKTKNLIIFALLAAILCVISPFSFSVGIIPVTLATFGIYLIASVFDMKTATVSVLLYVLLGTFGLPVFSGFSGGLQKLMGPTGGYIIGYIPMAFIIAFMLSLKRNRIVFATSCVISTAVLYAIGTLWFTVSSGEPLSYALKVCVFPFLPGDIIKIVLCIIISPSIFKALKTNKII